MNVYRILLRCPGDDAAPWIVAPRMVEARTDSAAKKRAAKMFPYADVHTQYFGKAWP